MPRPAPSARRVDRTASTVIAGGGLLAVVGVLSIVAGASATDWALIVLGVLGVVVAGVVVLIGLGLRRSVARSRARGLGLQIDALAAATIAAAATAGASYGRDAAPAAGPCAAGDGAAKGDAAGGDRHTSCGADCGAVCALAGLSERSDRRV